MAIQLVISGCCGRMGRSIATLALADSVYAIAGAVEASGHPSLGHDYGTVLGRPAPLKLPVTDDTRAALGRGDVLIEFTVPEVTIEHAMLADELRKPMVIGTTGLSQSQQKALLVAARRIPIVFSPNMSVGVNVLFELAKLAAERMGLWFDAAIIEAHHNQKKDSPSGTAKRLAEAVAAGRKQLPSSIPVHAIRAGDIVGDHTVIFAGASERLELTHRAQSRDVFAGGALMAARFVADRKPGLYDMANVLKGMA
jgi:4-hydroxy-tetrahydrodipicolinate reductase